MSSPNQKTSVPNGENMDPNGGSQSPNGKFMSFGRRLQSAAEKKKFNQAGLAKELGLTSGTFSRYWNGERLPPADTLVDVAEQLGVSPRWLIRGSESQSQTAEAASSANIVPDDMVEIREIDLHYGMGGSFLADDVGVETRVFSRDWLRNFTRAAPEHLFWTMGDGDSMEPTIRSGELILVDGSQRQVRVNDGIWAVAMGEIGMVKRIHFSGSDSVELLSDNTHIPPQPVAYDELHVIGRVVAVVRRL